MTWSFGRDADTLALSFSKLDPEDFDTRVSIWRGMLSVLDIDLPKRRLPKAVEDDIRQSMINCQKCGHATDCMKRLEKFLRFVKTMKVKKTRKNMILFTMFFLVFINIILYLRKMKVTKNKS